MLEYARKYLRYVRASLADADRLAPDLTTGAHWVEADPHALLLGMLGQQEAAHLFDQATSARRREPDEEPPSQINVIVCPYSYVLRPESGLGSKRLPVKVVPLVLYAKLQRDGRLEADVQSQMPVIPRNYLEPASHDVVLGSVDEADRVYATLDMTDASWSGLCSRGHELLAKVTGQDPEVLTLPQYEKGKWGYCLLYRANSSNVHIERLLDEILEDPSGRAYPLLQALLTVVPDLPIKSDIEMLAASALHVGQMECRYPLSISQREALTHHLARPEAAPDILAIDGPPGTGKTTLLLSAIASMWVKAAADEAEPPLIVAMSATNQAVVNILEAFSKVKEPEGPLAGRWLPGIGSYGQFLPSRSAELNLRKKVFTVHSLVDTGQELQHIAQNFEAKESLQEAKSHYLQRFATAFPGMDVMTLDKAAAFLNERIKEQVNAVREAVDAMLTIARVMDSKQISKVACEAYAAELEAGLQQLRSRVQSTQAKYKAGLALRQSWLEHLESEPWWHELLATIGFRSRRKRRDAAFRSRASNQYDELIADRLQEITDREAVGAFIEQVICELTPISVLPASIDGANAQRCELVPADQNLTGFSYSAVSVFRGSLMRIAQRATPFSRHPERGRGMFLREHRRCWPEIIAVCNALAYGGLLDYKRPAGPRKILPSLGYVHIPGTDKVSQTRSRYNLAEASAIAKWLHTRRAEIETAFQDDDKSLAELVAVVTPFVAQARQIQDALKSEFGCDPGITVGTVDALQGAEFRVVIFSPTHGVGTEPGRTRFDSNRSILNVAISRAQDAFLVFGNMHLFRPNGSHPAAIVGRFLFTGGDNELTDVPVELLVPGRDLPPGRLIRDLPGHRAVLADAFAQARFRLVIVSPFLRRNALTADDIAERIGRAVAKGVRVTIISDRSFVDSLAKASEAAEFDACNRLMATAGAVVNMGDGPGVHSKLILVDNSWLVVGSFNWLSAVRDVTREYARYESSLHYDGEEAFQMIRDSLKDLRPFIAALPPA